MEKDDKEAQCLPVSTSTQKKITSLYDVTIIFLQNIPSNFQKPGFLMFHTFRIFTTLEWIWNTEKPTFSYSTWIPP